MYIFSTLYVYNVKLFYSGWISLGSTEGEVASYTDEKGFHGRITRLNVWDRPLDFRTEIPKMVSIEITFHWTHRSC